MKITYLLLIGSILLAPAADAEAFAARKDAEYIATLRAVVNYKIDDEENLRDIKALRKDRRFNQDLQKMLNKLTNSRTKNTDNKRVQKILEQAGKDIYNILK